MKSLTTDKIRLKPEKLKKWVTHPLIHFIFWIVLLALDYLIQKKIGIRQVDMEVSLRNLFFVIVFVYTCIFIILPIFNKHGNASITFILIVIWMFSIITVKWTFLLIQFQKNTPLNIFILSEFGRYFHFLILALLYFFLITTLNLDKLIKKSHAEKIQLESSLDQMILSPHFIFNCLESISSEFYPKARVASQRLADFAELFSYTFKKNKSKFSTIQDELIQVKRFLEFQQYRFGNNLTIQTDFYLDNLLNAKLEIPKMTLMTLVENMFKHGALKKTEAESNHYKLKAIIDQNDIKKGPKFLFSTQNPISENGFKQPSHGIGIKTIKKILDHYYGSRYSLTTEVVDNLFTLKLEIHYEENPQYRTD